MTTPTEQLRELLTSGTFEQDFKQLAMALVRQGADITVRSSSGLKSTLLHIFALQNENSANNDEIAELVGLNADVLKSTDGCHRTALQSLMDALINKKCSFANFKQSAMTLARQGADTTLQSTEGLKLTLLHILALQNEDGKNDKDIAELVRLNDNVLKSTDCCNRTALQSLMDALINKKCSFANFKQSAMTLARQGADITLQSTEGLKLTLLHILALQNENGKNNKYIAELVGLNADVLKSTDCCSRTALQSLIDAFLKEKCSFANYKQSAMTLAQQGADLSLQGKAGTGPTLLHALVLNHIDENKSEIDALIELNHEVLNFKDYFGRTPVHSILSKNPNATIDVIEGLLSETNLHLKDNQNATLLHAACHSGNLTAVEYFVGKELSLTALTNRNETLIHYAVSSGNMTLIQWLIDRKQIDINAKDKSGETALDIATRQNNYEVAELLTHNGADLTIKNNNGQEASEIATIMGDNDAVDMTGEMASHPANCQNNNEVVELITHNEADLTIKNNNGQEASVMSNPKDDFFHKIQAMEDYGVLLRDQGVSKGQVAIDLANALKTMANQFFEQNPEQRNFAKFKPQFLALLHSKDQEMSAYRISWGTILANIGIALTGIGLLVIAGKLIHSKVIENQALFFFQNRKTTSEENIADVEHAVSLIAPSA
ncbi:ankyrin repeat domain-containing protein [Legionella sp.]|uniref:ankyrin repeat domain-containing protein n=1 Tax=Legionella sp. TaxID=459 RepID=UPI003CAB626D